MRYVVPLHALGEGAAKPRAVAGRSGIVNAQLSVDPGLFGHAKTGIVPFGARVVTLSPCSQ